MNRIPFGLLAASKGAALLGVAILLSSCGSTMPAGPRTYGYAVPLDQTFDLHRGRTLSEAEETRRFEGPGAPRLMFVGEHHADPRSQAYEVQVLHRLQALHLPVTVALEMFPPQADAALDAWRQGRLTEKDFVEQSHWYESWGFPWAAYRELFLAIRDGAIPTHGVNVDEATRKAVRESPTGELPEALRGEIGSLDVQVAPHREYLLDSLRDAGHAPARGAEMAPDSPGFLRMERIQVLWDTVMGVRAAHLAEAGPLNGVTVVMLGSGHVAYGLGANLRAARATALPQLTVWDDIVDSGTVGPQGSVTVPVGMADWVRVYRQDSKWKGYPSLAGLKLAAAPAGVRIEAIRAQPGDALAGFHLGDVIQALGAVQMTDAVQLRLAVERLPWNQTADVTVLRNGKSIHVEFAPKA